MTPRKKKVDRGFLCLDCTIYTSELGEYFTIRKATWLAAVPEDDGMLCIGCVEQRLGRKLTYDDFTWSPINLRMMFTGSERLRDRMNAHGMITHGLADLDMRTVAVGIIEAEMENERALARVRNKVRASAGAN